MTILTILTITVPGNPLPKQSFRYRRGRPYTDPRVRAWQDCVSYAARQMMQREEPLRGAIKIWMEFFREDHIRCDLDNLQKSILDGIKGIVFADDDQVVNIQAWKRYCPADPRVEITVQEIDETVYGENRSMPS